MKHFFLLSAVLFLGSCGECDNSKYYQIRMKDPDTVNPAMCHFGVEGMGACTTWQKTQQISFTDSCRRWPLSQVLSKAQVQRYSASGN